jgi:hypothetical protein
MPRLDKQSSERVVITRATERLGPEALTLAVIDYVQQLRQVVGQQLNILRQQAGLPPLEADVLPRLDRQRLMQILRQKLRDQRGED